MLTFECIQSVFPEYSEKTIIVAAGCNRERDALDEVAGVEVVSRVKIEFAEHSNNVSL